MSCLVTDDVCPVAILVRQKIVCVLIVQLPIHVMNRAPEEMINRKSEDDNKS